MPTYAGKIASRKQKEKKMKILVFTEGTILMHGNAKGVSRNEAVRQAKGKVWDLLRRILPAIKKEEMPGSPDDFTGYIPVGQAGEKLKSWKSQRAEIYYLTSRKVPQEVADIKYILEKYNFPDNQNLLFRKQGEQYQDVAEKLMPDFIVEDDCESIGGEVEMTYPHIRPDLKARIKPIIVKEFGGIDHLPNNIYELLKQGAIS